MKMRRKKRGLYGAGTRHVFAAASEVLEHEHHRYQAQHNMDVVHEHE